MKKFYLSRICITAIITVCFVNITQAEDITVVKPLESGGAVILSKSDEKASIAVKAANRGKDIGKVGVSRKARIVVVPASFSTGVRSRLERELYEKLGLSDPSVLENPGYTSQMVDSLVNCRKFDVLERSQLRDAAKELELAESEYADISKCIQLGNMLNADYIVIPEIRYLHFIKEKRLIPYIGASRPRYTAQIGTRVRVVNVGTSRIASSNESEVEIKETEKRRLPDKIKQAANFIRNIYAESTRHEVTAIIDVIYPIKILAVNGNNVTLNRGKGALKEGEKLKIYRTGEMLIDPDTQENLGMHETEIGEIKVSEVKPKFSIAKIVKLEEGMSVKKLDIARRSKREPFQRTNLPVTQPKID